MLACLLQSRQSGINSMKEFFPAITWIELSMLSCNAAYLGSVNYDQKEKIWWTVIKMWKIADVSIKPFVRANDEGLSRTQNVSYIFLTLLAVKRFYFWLIMWTSPFKSRRSHFDALLLVGIQPNSVSLVCLCHSSLNVLTHAVFCKQKHLQSKLISIL